jgi:multidrug efflux pump subunit AcrB
MSAQLVPLSEILRVVDTTRERSMRHKDLLPVVYVMGDMAGKTDLPVVQYAVMRKRVAGPIPKRPASRRCC